MPLRESVPSFGKRVGQGGRASPFLRGLPQGRVASGRPEESGVKAHTIVEEGRTRMHVVAHAWEIAAQRMFGILSTVHIEVSELISLGCAFAWAVPLLFNPSFLWRSPSLVVVREHIPAPVLLGIMLFLLVYQGVGVAVGGVPSYFIRSSSDVRSWFKMRRAGQYAAGTVWFMMSLLLLSSGSVTPGSFIHGFVGLVCFFGVWRFCLLIAIERELSGMREMRERHKAPAGGATGGVTVR